MSMALMMMAHAFSKTTQLGDLETHHASIPTDTYRTLSSHGYTGVASIHKVIKRSNTPGVHKNK